MSPESANIIYKYTRIKKYNIQGHTNHNIDAAISCMPFDPYPAKLMYLIFQPLAAVSHYRDSQLQVAENYSYLFNFSTHIFKS